MAAVDIFSVTPYLCKVVFFSEVGSLNLLITAQQSFNALFQDALLDKFIAEDTFGDQIYPNIRPKKSLCVSHSCVQFIFNY